MAQSRAETNEQAVRRIVRGLATNDMRPLFETMDENAVWVSHATPPHFRFGGEFHGRSGVMDMLAKIYAEYSFTRYDIDKLVEDGDEVWAINNVVVHHIPTGRSVALRLVFRMRFANGKLTLYEGFYDTALALEKMGRLAVSAPPSRPAIPDPPHKGACLCGAVRWQLNARPLGINACHCTDCQKMTGATNLLMLLAHSADFSHEGATARYRKRADSGREIDVLRCTNCGTRLWHEPLSSPEFVFIAAGTLDDPGWAVPATHIWTKRAGANVHFESDALVIKGQPESRQELFEAFSKLYPG